jgi:hypothetical protein
MVHPLLYEINTRCWLRELSRKYDRAIGLGEVPAAELERWQKLGFTHIWLMGVWTSGPRSRAEALNNTGLGRAYAQLLPDWQPQDVGGSPYAIAYYEVPPEMGGETGLAQFRRDLHQRGLKLVLDFVPNHVGLDHPWVKRRPGLFVQRAERFADTFPEETKDGPRWLAHGKDPFFPGWTDTVQLDYRLATTRAAMLEQLELVAAKCDGVRCDMAMLILNEVFAKTWERFPLSQEATMAGGPEFWIESISKVKTRYPDFLFLAEAYWGLEPVLHAQGFDFTYDKTLYDRLVAHDGPGVQHHLLSMLPQFVATGAHFLENHDEHRSASILSVEEIRAAALLIVALPGMCFLHHGQLGGARLKIPVQLVRCPEETEQPEVRRIYERLLLAVQATAVRRGRVQLVRPRPVWQGNPTHQNFVIVQWQTSAPAFDLAVVNLAPHRSQCYAPIMLPNLAEYDWELKDLLGNEAYLRQGRSLHDEGLYLDVAAHAAQLFHAEPVKT